MFVSQIYDEAAEILATTSQEKVFRKLTQAVQILMESGHYFHTTSEVDVCTGWDGQTITLPRGIEVPLAVNVDGSPTYFRGRLFQYHVNKGGMYNPVDWAWDDRGFVSTVMDIRQPSQLLAIAEHEGDAGKQIRVIGTDGNNRELRTQSADGKTIDGLLITIHAQSDYPLGGLLADDVTIVTRSVEVSPLTRLLSANPHQFSSGQSAVLTLTSGTLPSYLIAGKTYYIGTSSTPTDLNGERTIELYQTSLDAQYKTNPIQLQSIQNAGTLTLTDSRPSNLLTTVRMDSVPPIVIDTPNEVTFSTQSGGAFSGVLPSPLTSGLTYFANPVDTTNLQVYNSLNDAQSRVNPIALTGNSGKFNVDVRKAASPQTTLSFSVKHYYSSGDQVQAFTSGGTLPSPLLAGQNYFVNVIDAYTISLHENVADAIASNGAALVNPIIITDSGSGSNSIVKLIPAVVKVGETSQITATGFPIEQPTGSGAAATAIVTGSITNIPVVDGGKYASSSPVTITFAAPTNVPVGQVSATATASVTLIPFSVGSSDYKIGSIQIINGGLGYSSVPTFTLGGQAATIAPTITPVLTTSFVSRFTMTNNGTLYNEAPIVTFSGGGGQGATAVATVNPQTGQVTGITTIAQGAGYTSAPSVIITASTGTFVSFTSTGLMPSPLVEGTTYLANIPLNTASGTFTLNDTSGIPVNITSLGSGNFFLALSRTFRVTFNNAWSGDFSGVPTGTLVYMASDYQLPTGVNSSNAYYIRRLNNSTAQLFNTQGNANGSPSLTGLILVTTLGVGQSYYAIRTPAYARAYNNLITPSNSQYINSGTIVRFTSSGTLPYPLVINTDYIANLSGNNLSITTSGASPTPIVFTQDGTANGIPTLATGQLNLNIVRAFTPVASTSIISTGSTFEDGNQVAVRPNAGDSLPVGLVASTSVTPQYYYTRRVDNNSIELYNTKANALAYGSTTGRIAFVNIGNTVNSEFFIDSILEAVLAKAIYHIEKPETIGFVSLYAFDYGRSNDMALIGQYHPSETNPKYRRIRIGKPCAWARIIYRVSHPVITSKYDYIPVENERAIIAAVHAVDLEDKDFFDQSQRYWNVAFSYLRNQTESMEGHAMMPPQINGICYAEGTDPVMF